MKRWIFPLVLAATLAAVFIAYVRQPPGEIRAAAVQTPPSVPSPGKAPADSPAAAGPGTTMDTRHPDPSHAPEAALRHQMQAVATAWLASTRFPPYSVPLDVHNTAYMAPRKGQALSLPLANGSVVQWQVDKYIFVAPEPVSGQIEVSGGTADGLPEVWVFAGERRLGAKVTASGPGRYRFVWQPSETSVATMTGELRVHVRVTFQGKPLDFESRVQYQDPVAFVRGVGEPQVEGAHWVVPVQVEARQPGRYVLRANLLTAEGVPVAHLVSQQDLKPGVAAIVLRAHVSVLKLAGETPAYRLEGWQIYRKPLPGEKTRWGMSDLDRVQVAAFPLNAYADEPWTDPKAAQRQAFFERLAGASP